MKETYYSVKQIAKMLDMHPKTIQRYMREGRLPAQKVGKEWRVTGHSLSTFLEGTTENPIPDTSSGLQTIIGLAGPIKISTVIDIPVKSNAEAVHLMNWITASLHANSSEYGYTSMTSQFVEPDHSVRIMLWGSPAFMEVIMHSLNELGEKQNE